MAEGQKDYIKLVSEATNADYETTKKKMQRCKKRLGVFYHEYYKNELYNMTPTQQKVESRRISIRRENRSQRFEKVMAATGLNKKEINQKIKDINEKNIAKIMLVHFAKYEIYRYEGKQLDDFLSLLAHRNELMDELKNNFDSLDNGTLTYEDIDPLLIDLYNTVEKIMPESLYEELLEVLYPSHPELKENSIAGRQAAVKMETIRVLTLFSLKEYASFNFHDKDFKEIREFISDKERMRVLKEVNDPEAFDILDNKMQTYGILKEYYGRDLVSITSKAQFEIFDAFIKKHENIVIKPPCETQGRNIQVIHLSDYADTKELFDKLIGEYYEFIAEELIIANEAFRKLNPDSVNSVRLITYFDGNKSMIHKAFMKVGQKGSFVDNGSAGGILVSVDQETGILNSDGCDEKGLRYECHPYTGTHFNGYQLPDWENAKALCLSIAAKFPGLYYIGWDITYTENNEWIIIEGNAKTQFIGQQCTVCKGIRKEFLDLVQAKGGKNE